MLTFCNTVWSLHTRHDQGPACEDREWPSMGPIKCFSVCSYRKILEWRLFKSFYVKTFITSWPAVCRMRRNILPNRALAFGVNHSLEFLLDNVIIFNIRCTPSLPNMVSALIIVLLWKWNQIVMKKSWDLKSLKQWIQFWLLFPSWVSWITSLRPICIYLHEVLLYTRFYCD